MVAETVSLGVLSLPAAVAGLGLVPYVQLHAIDSVQNANIGQCHHYFDRPGYAGDIHWVCDRAIQMEVPAYLKYGRRWRGARRKVRSRAIGNWPNAVPGFHHGQSPAYFRHCHE